MLLPLDTGMHALGWLPLRGRTGWPTWVIPALGCRVKLPGGDLFFGLIFPPLLPSGSTLEVELGRWAYSNSSEGCRSEGPNSVSAAVPMSVARFIDNGRLSVFESPEMFKTALNLLHLLDFLYLDYVVTNQVACHG